MRKSHLPTRLAALLAVAAGSGLATAPAVAAPGAHISGGFNRPGDVLIADQFNNRVIEINRHHQIVWSFGDGSIVPGPHSIVGVNDAERVGTLTLLAGTGAPPAPSPSEPGCEKSGCADNRVILVDREGHIVWQYGQAGVTGSGQNELNTPVFAAALPHGHVLITDQGNSRVIEVNPEHEIVWQYGTTGTPGAEENQLNNPNSAELLANGHILISDENNNRAIEVTHNDAKKIVATFTVGGTASGVAFASRLANGDTLLTDSNNSRIVEVNSKDQPVWQYFTNDKAGNSAPLPTRAVRLRDGETLISDQFNDRVIEVVGTPPMGGTIERHIGALNVFGIGHGLLDAPYSAYVIGDYTGLTPPFGFED
jgi:outer membrane protein assembly factor BamB